MGMFALGNIGLSPLMSVKSDALKLHAQPDCSREGQVGVEGQFSEEPKTPVKGSQKWKH